VSDGELPRLAALEQTLVAAAGRQAQRRRFRRRRLIVALALAAPLTLAAASVASTQGLFGGVDEQLSALRDDRLLSPEAASPGFFDSLGALPRDRASRRSWLIGGQHVTGYLAASGAFCFRFGPLTGGCIAPGELTAASPVSYTVDYGPSAFHVYGLAYDGVTRISLRTHGGTRPVLLAHNAFYLDDPALAGVHRLTAMLIVHLRGGAVRHLPIHMSGGLRPTDKALPLLPGVLPAGDTAA
jgi:hypothetical protein